MQVGQKHFYKTADGDFICCCFVINIYAKEVIFASNLSSMGRSLVHCLPVTSRKWLTWDVFHTSATHVTSVMTSLIAKQTAGHKMAASGLCFLQL